MSTKSSEPPKGAVPTTPIPHVTEPEAHSSPARTPAPTAAPDASAKAAPEPAPVSKADTEAETDDVVPEDPEGIINMEIFSQIQDMDDEDDEDGEGGGHEFSKGIVWGYFEQAENTFQQMEEAIGEPSLSKLSSLGHFLKGSSAALGIVKVQDSCEKMQHYGNLRDEEVGVALTEEEALRRIKGLLVDCKRDYKVASRWLRRLYGEDIEDGADDAEKASEKDKE